MIQILTGVPGGGKSYYAVSKILKTFEANALLDDQSLKVLVVHNIHGFNDERAISVDFGSMVLDASALFKFFDELRIKHGLDESALIDVYIDEAQRYFPYEYKNPDGVYFFDFHRHHGLNITLISQDIKKLSPKITTLAEQEIRAVKPMFQITPGFTYNLLSSGEQFGKERLPKRKDVFDAYTSFLAGKVNKKKSKYKYILPAAVALAIILFLVLQVSFKNSFAKIPTNKDLPISELNKESEKYKPMPSYKKTVDSGMGASSDSSELPDVRYMAPNILRHKGQHVTYNDDDGLEITIPFEDFRHKFPPDLYGYSYVAVKKTDTLIIMDRYSNEYLYPVENKVARAVNYIKNEPDSPGRDQDNLSPDPLTLYPDEPKGWGYTMRDKRILAYWSQVARGLNPAFPDDLRGSGVAKN